MSINTTDETFACEPSNPVDAPPARTVSRQNGGRFAYLEVVNPAVAPRDRAAYDSARETLVVSRILLLGTIMLSSLFLGSILGSWPVPTAAAAALVLAWAVATHQARSTVRRVRRAGGQGRAVSVRLMPAEDGLNLLVHHMVAAAYDNDDPVAHRMLWDYARATVPDDASYMAFRTHLAARDMLP